MGEVKEASIKYSELLNDSILKLSFLTDNDFTVALKVSQFLESSYLFNI